MAKLLFTISFSLLAFISYGQIKFFTTKDSLNSYCDRIMLRLQEGKFSTAVQMLRRYSVIDTATINNIDKTLNEQMEDLLPHYKKLVGYEFAEEKSINNTLTRRRYLLKFENYFLIFDFVLYDNGSGWKITNFNYKDDPKELF